MTNKRGLQSAERRQSIFYQGEKKKLQANILPDLNGIKRHTTSMLDTLESALLEHINETAKDGLDLHGEMLDELIEMCSHTRAYQVILNDLTLIVNKN